MSNKSLFPKLEERDIHIFTNHENKVLKVAIVKGEIDIIFEDNEWWLISGEKERFEDVIRSYRGYKFWLVKFMYAIINRIERTL
jgi:hypothetical protein